MTDRKIPGRCNGTNIRGDTRYRTPPQPISIANIETKSQSPKARSPEQSGNGRATSPQLPLNGYERKWIPLMHIGGSSVSVDCDQAWRIRKGRRITKRGFDNSPSFTVDVTINGLTLDVPVCNRR